ncbi:MAG: ArsR family transcriptional regulator [Gammaproteobacteria bacterium RBG_16_57_12]|nr:MAG: ArsR family transcriptional regulator [Gammaproteobacteria bacterium RBG_16_57_12]
MAKIRKRGEQIRQFILDNVEHHPKDVSNLTAKTFEISRQAVNKHIQRLAEQKSLLVRGTTRNKHYILHPLDQWEQIYALDGTLEEHMVWRNEIHSRLDQLPENVVDIWHYGFTEMLNNAIDHSSGTNVSVHLKKTATTTEIIIYDNGEGIFRKIQREMQLTDERHAVLELSKGKLTTDPNNHTGEGIFFSSRMFDDYTIVSGNVYFSHSHYEVEDWILENQKAHSGTGVFMKLKNNTSRTAKKVFDSFTSDDEYGFTKTVVPVRLAQYGDEKLVSRSQAKRLLARVDRFKVVIFDFDGVETIGQAFADEVFRVFKNYHPEIELLYINATKEVTQMITRAKSRIEP